MKKPLLLSLLLIFALLGSSIACGIDLSGDSTNAEKNKELEALQLQVTVQALQLTQVASVRNQQPSPQAQQIQQQPAQQQPAVDNTAQQAQPAPPPPEDDGTPCNSSKFVSETIPDFTNFQPGAAFAKTWTLRNAGDCDWTDAYKFEYEEGDRMNGESVIPVTTVIEPGETITFKVNLKAPNAAGDYVGVWRLKAGDGELLGKYWVKIKVGGGAAPAGQFAVTGVSLSTGASPIHIDCPGNVTVKAAITSGAPGTVTYKWEDCEGGNGNGSLVFDAAGTKSVSHKVAISFSDPGHWARIYIDTPNHQYFGPKMFEVVCD